MLTAVCIHGARRRRPVHVADAERALLGLASGRLGRVVCLVALATRAAARRNPEVGRTGVEDDLERLRRSPDRDGANVGRVLLL